MSRPEKIEMLANSATVLVTLILSAVLLQAFLLEQPSDHPKATYCQPGKGINLKPYLPGVDWAQNGRTLIFALSARAQYQSGIAPFYHRIDQERAKDVRLLAIFRESEGEGRKYLREYGVHMDDVRHALFPAMEIKVVPILMLVDDSGTITDTWEGELSDCEEEEVIAAVKQGPKAQAEAAQGPGAKTVYIYPEHLQDPVKIVRITEDGKEVLPGRYSSSDLPGKPFRAGDDWLKDLSVVLKNRTSKNIASVQMNINFPVDEADLTGAGILWTLNLGEIPANARIPPAPGALIPEGTGRSLHLAPGQEMTISLADQAEAIRTKIEEKKPFTSVTKCRALLGAVFFEDGMKWAGYSYGYAQPISNTWVRTMDGSYFPGELNPMFRLSR